MLSHLVTRGTNTRITYTSGTVLIATLLVCADATAATLGSQRDDGSAVRPGRGQASTPPASGVRLCRHHGSADEQSRGWGRRRRLPRWSAGGWRHTQSRLQSPWAEPRGGALTRRPTMLGALAGPSGRSSPWRNHRLREEPSEWCCARPGWGQYGGHAGGPRAPNAVCLVLRVVSRLRTVVLLVTGSEVRTDPCHPPW